MLLFFEGETSKTNILCGYCVECGREQKQIYKSTQCGRIFEETFNNLFLINGIIIQSRVIGALFGKRKKYLIRKLTLIKTENALMINLENWMRTEMEKIRR